jgi:hydrogenase/urease accessory protein HupE
MKSWCYAIFVVIGFVLAAPADAHEIGTTQLLAEFDGEGSYRIDITVDPDALLTRLQVAVGVPVTTSLGRLERDREIVRLWQTLVDVVTLRFDETTAAPSFEYLPASRLSDLAQVPSIVRLTGRVPAGAGVFTLKYGLVAGSYAMNVRIGDSPAQTVWVDGARDSEKISLASPSPAPTRAQIAWQYLVLGFTHILPKGLDHILFVVGIFLLAARWRSVFLQVSTFTIAHSITLGLTMYGVVSLPARVVEPLIALSIAYVALENLITSELKPWRLALVFSFGLLHGMGFAGVLRDLGLPRGQFLTALMTFNLGVEAGQLAVIALACAAVAYWRANGSTYRRFVVQPASLAIAMVGVYWTIQRAFL